MSGLNITTKQNDVNSLKIQVTSEFCKQPLKVEFVEEGREGNFPVLTCTHGELYGANAISKYIGRVGSYLNIFGGDLQQAGEVDQWVEWVHGEIDMPLKVWLAPTFNLCDRNEAAEQYAKEDVKKALKVLNNHLRLRSFLVGERITLADIVVFFSLYNGYVHVFNKDFRKGFENVTRWFLTIMNQPQTVRVVSPFPLLN